ncbi:hypothetical protein THICB1_10071 [Thiomonas arsenitoxydans]|uniref:Uncharacterized protein n=1 Tax=Thiomonas arsenitoxydans (strain DSM 22701 / CIP 110005 / 3As) TaxID=426114 RepID=A0ABM9SZ51_THIA3|nr:hypothetical protein THICB1_10071 [Thiomonas arsenitoxydans]
MTLSSMLEQTQSTKRLGKFSSDALPCLCVAVFDHDAQHGLGA